MWRNHPLSQRNKAKKRALEVEVYAAGAQNLKIEGLGNTGGLDK